MATRSVAALGPKTGRPSPAGPVSSECEELEQRNEQRREDLKEVTRDQSVVGPRKSGKGTTMSSCTVTPGRPRMRSAHSNQKAYEKTPNGLVEGGDTDVRDGTDTTTCGHQHPDPAMQKSGHAEARLLDDVGTGGALPPNTRMTFNIDWRKRNGRPSKMPCMTCHRYMCKVAQDCDVKISLCDKQNVKHELPCPPTRANRAALKKKLDGRAR